MPVLLPSFGDLVISKTFYRKTLYTFVLMVLLLLLTEGAKASRCFHFSEEIGIVCDGRLQPEPQRFQDPAPKPGSLLQSSNYAYMEDYIDIYPEPNVAVPPLYNVGRGFLYVTIYGEVEANGSQWYEINPGEYALKEGIRVVQTPAFHGKVVNVQPQHPFGWIVQDVVPSPEPDGEPLETQRTMQRYDFFQVYDAVRGADDWIWYRVGPERWIRQTYVSLLDTNVPPEKIGEGDFWVEVDLYEQTMAAYEGRRMVYAGLISSGLNRWPTYEGLFQVYSRHLQTPMSGAEGKIDYYSIEDVPYTMYFDRHNEIALHGAYWHNRFGYKHSHGCVNMPPLDAEWIYYWSEDAPNDVWVWVHTSDPDTYFERFKLRQDNAQGVNIPDGI